MLITVKWLIFNVWYVPVAGTCLGDRWMGVTAVTESRNVGQGVLQSGGTVNQGKRLFVQAYPTEFVPWQGVLKFYTLQCRGLYIRLSYLVLAVRSYAAPLSVLFVKSSFGNFKFCSDTVENLRCFSGGFGLSGS